MPVIRFRSHLANSVLARTLTTAWVLAGLATASTTHAQGQGAVPSGGTSAVAVPGDQPAQPKAQEVTPPQLKTFVNAPYPPEAEKQGLEGAIVLQLDIDASGKVTTATVVNPAGHGFDEAAQEAARQFVFAPALRGGKAVAARILYRYTFTLKKAAAEPGKPEPARPTTGRLAGVVRAGSDVPIAGAEVTVRDASGSERSSRASEDGIWSFADLPAGTFTVTVRSPGYRPLELEEKLVAGEATEVVYRLVPEGELQVVVRGTRPPREVTRRTLEKREIERIPGTNGDALRSIQNLPGVARAPGFGGILVVRGSAPSDTAVFADGTEIPLIYHFGGLSSVIPTELLERIDFYPGNFSAQFGRVNGGIINVGMRSPKTDGRYHGMAQLDLIDGRALIEGPVPFVKNWHFVAAGRRSWVDAWLKPVLKEAGASVTAAPVYYDYQAYAETKPSERSSFRVGVYGADDRLELLLRDTAENEPAITGNVRLQTTFYRVFATYRNDLSDKVSLFSTTAVGQDVFSVGLGSLYLDIRTNDLSNRTELTAKVARGATLHTGIDMLWGLASVATRIPQAPEPGEPDAGPFATRPPLTVDTETYFYRPAAYAELELTPYRRLKLVPGIRADYSKDIQRWNVAPRFNARYAVAEQFPRTTLKGGIGVFHRPPDFAESYPPYGTKGLYANRALHYAVGVEQDLARQIETSVEGFYKDFDQLVTRAPTSTGGYEYANVGSGYAVGLETLIKYKPDSRFFGWLAYTLSRSMRRDSPSEPLVPYQYDQTHILTMLGSYRLGRGWEFGARFRLVTGNLTTPIAGAFYNANAGTYVAVNAARAFSERLPLFNQLDLRIDKMWDYGTWRLRTYLDVQNVYYAQNVEGYSYNYNYSQRSRVTGLPIIPSLGIRGEF